MTYIDFLNNDKVVENYNKIDMINPFPFNHGIKHVKNVCKIMDRLCSTLEITGEEKEALLIASALHDVGQVYGREEHGRKSKEYIIENFESEFKDYPFYSDMLEAIEKHSDPYNMEDPLFTTLLQFCDKMDFSKERLEDNHRERFRYFCYENIDRVDFINSDENFGINIITSDIDNFTDLFLSEEFTKKIINAVKMLAKKLNKKPVILNNGVPINIENEYAPTKTKKQ
jgi:hypothetical protein